MTAESVLCTFHFKLYIFHFLAITYQKVDGGQARLLDSLQRKFLKLFDSAYLWFTTKSMLHDNFVLAVRLGYAINPGARI